VQAARHACDIMGQRKYYEQVIEDTIDHHMYRIADEIDIATRKDSIQVSAYKLVIFQFISEHTLVTP
jgi:uncharacterized protein YlaN (UPF0358 family)